jgi:DNA modification methylase
VPVVSPAVELARVLGPYGTGQVHVVRADARRLPLPDATIDLICTSPPYFQQRDYQDCGAAVAGQLGQENTPDGYVDALLDATAEWVRVLKPAGSLWVNLGDKLLRSGSLALLPQRYAVGCADRLGLVIRAEVVWHKPSPMPEGRVVDRVHRAHETWLHLTRSRDYWADLDPLREPPKWTRPELYRQHKPRAVEGQPAHGWTSEGHPLGRPPGSVWTVPTEPFPTGLCAQAGLAAHTAAFPVEFPRRLVLGWCPPGGVVLDPCGGTGTVAHVAAALGRIGITADLSAGYCRLASLPDLAARRRAKALTGKPAVHVPVRGATGTAELL